jgi:predicted anti-sigma-YlaC factor YlaD
MKAGDDIMKCKEAKDLLRKGRQDQVQEHLADCPDCRAFAEDFGEIAEFLSNLKDTGEYSERLYRTTLSLARAELRSHHPARAHQDTLKTLLATGFAIILAPVLIVLNYWIATGGQLLIARWLPPVFGTLFFIFHVLGAVLSLSIAYGSLPLLFAAARNVLHSRTVGGGLPS